MVRLQRRGSDARSWSDKLLQRRAARKQGKVAPNGRHCAAMLARMRGRHRAGDFAALRLWREKGATARNRDGRPTTARRPRDGFPCARAEIADVPTCHGRYAMPSFPILWKWRGKSGEEARREERRRQRRWRPTTRASCGRAVRIFLPANAPVRKTRMVKRVTMKGDPTTGGICRRLRRDRVSIGERIDLGRGLKKVARARLHADR